MSWESPRDLEEFAAHVRATAASGRFPAFDPEIGETVLAADEAGPGHWVGAPSVVVDPRSGRVLMVYRRRRPRDGSARERGYLVAIGASTDGGRSFAPIWQVTKEEVGTSSLERFCLRPGLARGWVLYASWEDPPSSGRWRISVLQAPEPDRFVLADAQPVLGPDDVGVDAVKDPYVVRHHDELLMYISTFLTPHGPAPTSLATSADGLRYVWRGETLAVGRGGGWDAYQARLSCVVPFAGAFVGYYDGAGSRADDTEEHCGIACSLDLMRWQPISLDGPALVSPHATGSLRYVEALAIDGAWWAYYEYTRADGAHELRRSRLDMP
jgi:hypothetical protein